MTLFTLSTSSFPHCPNLTPGGGWVLDLNHATEGSPRPPPSLNYPVSTQYPSRPNEVPEQRPGWKGGGKSPQGRWEKKVSRGRNEMVRFHNQPPEVDRKVRSYDDDGWERREAGGETLIFLYSHIYSLTLLLPH